MPSGSRRAREPVKVEAERPGPGPIVQALGPRGFRIEEGWAPALLLTPVSAHAWTPPPFEELGADALGSILDPAPEFVLLGTGPNLRRAPRPLVAALEARGIGVEAMDSRAAARAWGVIRGEGRRISAALYPLEG